MKVVDRSTTNLKSDLQKLLSKITPGPWTAETLDIRFINNYLPPSSAKAQPTLDDLRFIEYIREHIDEIIEGLDDCI